MGLKCVADPQGGSLGFWASKVGTSITAEEQERGQGRRKVMEGGERTWGRGGHLLGAWGIPSVTDKPGYRS